MGLTFNVCEMIGQDEITVKIWNPKVLDKEEFNLHFGNIAVVSSSTGVKMRYNLRITKA